MDDQLNDVREGDELDWGTLERHLRSVLDLPDAPMQVRQFTGGAANLGSEHHCLGIAPTLPLSCPPWRRSTAPRTLGGALDRPRHLSYLPSGPLALDEIKC